MYLKMAMRCLTSCLRLEICVERFMAREKPLGSILKLIDIISDEEIVANGCKCIRICLRDVKVRLSLFDPFCRT